MSAVGARIYVATVEAYRPGGLLSGGAYGWGAWAWGAPFPPAVALEDTQVIRASDCGYCSEVVSGDVTPYPPVLADDWTIDRHIDLMPSSTATAATWGSLRLINSGGRFDQIATEYSPDSRVVSVLTGRRGYDEARGYPLDPPLADLSPLFGGLAETWRLSEQYLEIPLRDATYWLERAYQQETYAGTGGLNGSAEITGQTKPRARGGTTINPIRAVSPVLIDATKRIYQYNDASGSVVQVYEGAAAVFTSAGNTGDLYSGSTPAGQYRTDNSRGLFQLGSPAVGPITADVTGDFPVAGAASTAGDVARLLLTEDMALPAALIDETSFAATGALSRLVGWYWPSGDASSGAEALSAILRGAVAKLVPGRNGKLRALLLGPISSSAVPKARLTTAQIVSLRPNRLSAPLDPPAYRWRVGYRRNHTPQTSGLNAGLTDAQRREAGQEWRLGVWSSTSVLGSYARPSDPDVISTALLVEGSAKLAAQAIGALWGERRTLYDVELPEQIAMTLDLGQIVSLTYPAGDLRTGRLGRIVGEQLRVAGGLVTLQVLV